MTRLQQRNPQGFQLVQNLMNSNGDPNKMVNQIMHNINPEQRQNILSQAKSYGAPDSILSQLQNIK